MNSETIEQLIEEGYSDEEISFALEVPIFIVQEHRLNQFGYEGDFEGTPPSGAFLQKSVTLW